MFATLLLVLALVSTPVASPIAVDFTPDTTVVLTGEPIVSPLVTTDAIIVALASGDVVALSLDGEPLWDTPLPAPASNALVLMDDLVLVPGEDGSLYVLDRASGDIEETVVLASQPLVQPIVVEESLFVGDIRGTIHVVDRTDFRETNAIVVGSELYPGAVLVGDTIVVVADTRVATAIDTQTQTVLWQSVLADNAFVLATTPADEIVIGGEHGFVTLLAPTGEAIWQSAAGSLPVTDVTMTDSGVVVSLEDGMVVELDDATGSVNWRSVATSRVWFPTDQCSESCLVMTDTGMLASLDVTDGAITPIVVVATEVTVAPVLSAGRLVVPLTNGTLLIWNHAAE
ncbi:MAG: PQQ-binding-like beta-propeller repeat protein [Thermomicrobiales bacterium]|nr:PQQ-binding-like beta-propeller repeat protein [Thermomicrobiales bacterium]